MNRRRRNAANENILNGSPPCRWHLALTVPGEAERSSLTPVAETVDVHCSACDGFLTCRNEASGRFGLRLEQNGATPSISFRWATAGKCAVSGALEYRAHLHVSWN